MSSIGLKKKKRKAAKKKKKYNKAKKNKSISIHSPTNVEEEDDLETEESLNGCLSNELIPESELISQSQSMEGSGNDGREPVIVEKEEVVEVVKEVESIGDSANRSVSIEESGDGGSLVDGASTSHEEPQVVEKNESLEKEKEEAAKLKEEHGNSIVEFVEKTVSEMVGADNVEKIASVTEKVIPIIEEGIKKETEVKMMISKVLETIPVQKTKALDFVDSVSKENEDRLVSSSDNPRIETSDRTEEHTDAPFGQAIVQRTTWKSCCGLLEVLTGSNR